MSTPKFTAEEWRSRATELFGPDPLKWRFVCPACGHIASVQDWKDVGASSDAAAYSCVGRWSKEPVWRAFGDNPKGVTKGPCDYAGGGLIGLNPVVVIGDDGKERRVFAFDEEVRDEHS